MAQPYQHVLTRDGEVSPYEVMRVADQTIVPLAPGNVDYAEYQAWLDEGNQPDPAPEPLAPAPKQTGA